MVNEVGCCFRPEVARRRLGLVHEPEEGSCPSCSSIVPADADRRRRCRDFTPGRPPRNKGLRYPADPPKVEEIIAVMRAAGDGAHGRRLRGLIVILWRAGLRIQEALALTEADLDQRRGSLLVRRGKGGRRREVGMDDWGWRATPALARAAASSCPSGRCSASSTGRRAADPGRPPPPARSSAAPRPRPACAAASRRTSSATPTPSRWRAKASR